MCQEDWEHYIKTEEFKNCGSDFKGLVNEFITRFWFAKQERIFFKEYSTQDLDKKIEDKFKQDYEAKELRYIYYYSLKSKVVRDTLKALITELKIEQQFIMAMANKISEASGDLGERKFILAMANKRFEAPGDLGVNCCPTGILINDV